MSRMRKRKMIIKKSALVFIHLTSKCKTIMINAENDISQHSNQRGATCTTYMCIQLINIS